MKGKGKQIWCPIMTLAQNVCGIPLYPIMALANYWIDLLALYAIVNYLFIPCSLQNSSNSFEVKSPPLLGLMHFILHYVSFSFMALNFLKFSKAFDFFLKKATHVILLKSLMKSMKYNLP